MTRTHSNQAIDAVEMIEVAEPARINALQTESVAGVHPDLDTLDTAALIQAFARDQLQAVQSVLDAVPQMEAALNAMVERIQLGGRLVYVGAGTSGRLGLLDSVELHPTFSWPPERAVALLAGGMEALGRAVENAEDSPEAGAEAIKRIHVDALDCVLALAASGRTPYCIGAMEEAKKAGALCIALVNNPDAPLGRVADHVIELLTGPEVISGSTRLKAGTAQKIALNTLSSSLMVKLGKVYGNLMIDVRVTNEKLRIRACRLLMQLTGIPHDEAIRLLKQCDYQVKVALVAVKQDVSIDQAKAMLTQVQGRVNLIVGQRVT